VRLQDLGVRLRRGQSVAVPQRYTVTALAGLFAATFLYAISLSGQVERFRDEMRLALNNAARSAGLGITSVAIGGLKELEEWQVLEALDVDETRSLLTFDASEAREKLEAVPWIEDATVLKLYPGTLKIAIAERSAYALWQKGGKLHVIDAQGHVLEPYEEVHFSALPIVVGEGAAEAAPPLFAALASEPQLLAKLRAAARVSGRFWTLKLHDGTEVKLPDAGLGRAVAQLADLDRRTGLLDRDILGIDMRFHDRLVVRLSEGAAERWRLAAKEREKRLKGAST